MFRSFFSPVGMEDADLALGDADDGAMDEGDLVEYEKRAPFSSWAGKRKRAPFRYG